jgi:hypothetical protein
MAPYSGCFGCGLPQALCSKQGSGGCTYKDIVIPLAWAVRAEGERWRETLETIAGRRRFASDIEYLGWLGERCTVLGGEQGSNLFAVAAAALAEIWP